MISSLVVVAAENLGHLSLALAILFLVELMVGCRIGSE